MSDTQAEVETYVKRTAFNSEVRPVGEPITHAEDAAATLAERRTLVRVRPFYKVPTSRSSLTTVRSPFTFEAHVVRVLTDTTVAVRMTAFQDTAPWAIEASFYVSELHRAHSCECAACKGEHGIQHERGA